MRSRMLGLLGISLLVCVACGGSGDDTSDGDGGSGGSGGAGGSHQEGGSKDATNDTTVGDVSNDTAAVDVVSADVALSDVTIHDGSSTDVLLSACGSPIDGGMGKEYFGSCPGTETCCPLNTANHYACRALDGGMCPLLP
jgi:hypothetical protein